MAKKQLVIRKKNRQTRYMVSPKTGPPKLMAVIS